MPRYEASVTSECRNRRGDCRLGTVSVQAVAVVQDEKYFEVIAIRVINNVVPP